MWSAPGTGDTEDALLRAQAMKSLRPTALLLKAPLIAALASSALLWAAACADGPTGPGRITTDTLTDTLFVIDTLPGRIDTTFIVDTLPGRVDSVPILDTLFIVDTLPGTIDSVTIIDTVYVIDTVPAIPDTVFVPTPPDTVIVVDTLGILAMSGFMRCGRYVVVDEWPTPSVSVAHELRQCWSQGIHRVLVKYPEMTAGTEAQMMTGQWNLWGNLLPDTGAFVDCGTPSADICPLKALLGLS